MKDERVGTVLVQVLQVVLLLFVLVSLALELKAVITSISMRLHPVSPLDLPSLEVNTSDSQEDSFTEETGPSLNGSAKAHTSK
jgi:hypothetical protein